MQPTRLDALQLLQEGALVFADIEANGMHVDINYCHQQDRYLTKKIAWLFKTLEKSELGRIWRETYGEKMNINSSQQMGVMLYDKLGFEPQKFTPTGARSADQEAREGIDHPDLDIIQSIKQHTKARDTYIAQMIREECNELLHPFFNLHTVTTYRSSSDKPNFHNIPVRIEEIKRCIRRGFLSSPGNFLCEQDHSGLEVKTSACYHKDPNMIALLEDPTRDLHMEETCLCYLLPEEEVTSEIRYCGKNKFVFPQFYGNYYAPCAADLWEAITFLKLKTVSGVPLKEHLANEGIKNLKEFEKHIRDVEYIFWNEKFPVYNQWRKDWVTLFQKRGYFETLTGFRCRGLLGKNDILSWAIQGTGFHILLQGLIQVHKRLKAEKWDSKIIGQIHDSMVSDINPSEWKEFLPMTESVMTEGVQEIWDWIIVPLKVDTETAPIDGSWYEKKKYKV